MDPRASLVHTRVILNLVLHYKTGAHLLRDHSQSRALAVLLLHHTLVSIDAKDRTRETKVQRGAIIQLLQSNAKLHDSAGRLRDFTGAPTASETSKAPKTTKELRKDVEWVARILATTLLKSAYTEELIQREHLDAMLRLTFLGTAFLSFNSSEAFEAWGRE